MENETSTQLKPRNSFTGSLGFVLAAAGSAVGLGNIWRFPYLAAKDGGGLFLVVYLVLAITLALPFLSLKLLSVVKHRKVRLLLTKKFIQNGDFWESSHL